MNMPGDSKTDENNSLQGMDMPDENKLDNIKDEPANNLNIVPKKIDVSMDFIMQLNEVYSRYIILKNTLVNSDSDEAGSAAKKVKESLFKGEYEAPHR